MKRKSFIWWLLLSIILCSARTDSPDCKGRLYRKTAENIYGTKWRSRSLPVVEGEVLVIIRGRDCHECFEYVIDQVERVHWRWSILYLTDGDSELSVAGMRDILSRLKKNLQDNEYQLDDHRVFFLKQSLFELSAEKFPVIIVPGTQKGDRQCILYEEIWSAMNGHRNIF